MEPRIIVALDFDREQELLRLVDQLSPEQCRLKIGKQAFVRCGPGLVTRLQARGFSVFLDLKFHDIPNTVAAAVTAAADLGVWMTNVHAMGGRAMLEAAAEARDAARPDMRLIGVTILTSHGADDLRFLGIDDLATSVMALADLVADTGLDGVVCSPREALSIKNTHGTGFLRVTPGIRAAGADHGDQRRVATAAEAIESGASYLVIGRQVTSADNPKRALLTLNSEISHIASH